MKKLIVAGLLGLLAASQVWAQVSSFTGTEMVTVSKSGVPQLTNLNNLQTWMTSSINANSFTNSVATWLTQITGPTFPSQVVCSGLTTDVTVAMQSDMNAFSTRGGGRYQLPTTPCLVGTSASLNIPTNVNMVGRAVGLGFAGSPPSGYVSAPYTLLVASNPITFSSNSGAAGISVIASGFSPGSTMRSEIQAVKGFSGTGMSCSGSVDVNVRDVMVLGFSTGILAACDRMNFRDIRGDNTTTLNMTSCNDACTMEDVEAWPFVTPPGGVAQYQVTNISNVTSSGGLIKISFASAPTFPIVTGDTIVIAGVGGVTAANGRWTVTALDTSDFTLNGSTFSGTYTSGGTAFLNATIRHGTGVLIGATGGSPWMSHVSTFGYDTGIWYNGSQGAMCRDCWIDNFTLTGNYDPAVIGVKTNNGAGGNLFSGFINTPGVVLLSDPGNGTNNGSAITLENLSAGLYGGQAGVQSIQIVSGNVRVVGGSISAPTGYTTNQLYVSDAASGLSFTNTWNGTNVTASYQSTADCAKVSWDGTTGPCSWTPVLYGATTAGSYTAASGYPAGTYTVNSSGVVNVWGHVSYSAFSGAAGNATISGLPVTNGSTSSSSCTIGRASGIALGSGYTQLALDIATNSPRVDLNALGTGLSTTGINSANLSSAPELDFACIYHK